LPSSGQGGKAAPATAATAPGIGGNTSTRGRMSAWADLLRIKIPARFWEWAHEFRPELILGNLGSIRQIRLTTEIAEKLRLRAVPFFHDDWPSTMYSSDAATRYPRRVLHSELNRFLGSVDVGLANSEAMAQEFATRYGRPFHDFSNCVEVAEFEPRPTQIGDMEFTYIGGLRLGRWEGLCDIAEAMQAVRQRGQRAVLNIYGPVSDLSLLPDWVQQSEAVRIKGSVPNERAAKAAAGSDVLVHVESFRDEIRRYTRLSFSTKLPLYMAAGRPLLAYGPDEGASCRFVQNHGLGIVVPERNKVKLAEAISTLCGDRELRRTMGIAGRNRALHSHTVRGMGQRFREVMLAAAGADHASARKS
jgi:glycosyltransferase involved in cell wall biosynthesis